MVFPLPDGTSVSALIAGGLEPALAIGAEARRGAGVRLDIVTLQLPFRPPSIRDFVTFEAHVEGVRKSVDGASGVPDAWYDAPTFYFTNPHALYGPDQAVPRPKTCRALDFELEVACVLGRGGTDLDEKQARESIFGYTIMNDWSARDIQSREMKVGLGPAKGKDFATSIGPWVVTADEVDDLHTVDGFLDLDCSVSVNGAPVGHDRLSNMNWTFAQMIAYASRDSLVVPGDLLASGTTGGGGCLAELWGRRGRHDPPPLEPNDEVRIDVERIGSLTGSVAGTSGHVAEGARVGSVAHPESSA
ncbi:fumarylacetoacetate hydrolase family protein [Nostocoides sp. HKS02]|uniref:fumarylacetoacetate hydrolase family protein n=1 Tax=Nostocoides sp. HKS02 TaxID=1813880 RepID=UPI00351BAD42